MATPSDPPTRLELWPDARGRVVRVLSPPPDTETDDAARMLRRHTSRHLWTP